MSKLAMFSGTKVENANSGKKERVPVIVDTPSGLMPETQFRKMLARERKRSERSNKHLLLMLIDGKGSTGLKDELTFVRDVADCLAKNVRETDMAGWFETDTVFGVIFTELGDTDVKVAMSVIQVKVTASLQKAFKPAQLNKILVSFYAFPDGWDADGNGNGRSHSVSPALYPDLFENHKQRKLSLLVKRTMDITGSSVALALTSPLFLLLAGAIKLTSKGPVFFRQERIGQFGVPFLFLKFRSMRQSNDAGIHKQYVKDFIEGKAAPKSTGTNGNGNRAGVYKITNDPRVTFIGKIMRRTSLDEVPQFWNVLKGEMSLVGPRPPIRYEIEAYDVWHRRRLLEVKPGITGLWQVQGRSRTTFDDMVRLDLQYSRTWTPLLDAKILLQTPRAVISGDGAF
jgi:lipopolysaccharide/colanic/teichoic acid biosynthesis glycosyltransferase/GGDEF domain-containing protein